MKTSSINHSFRFKNLGFSLVMICKHKHSDSGARYKIAQQALEGKLKIFIAPETLVEIRKVLQDPKKKFNLSTQETEGDQWN